MPRSPLLERFTTLLVALGCVLATSPVRAGKLGAARESAGYEASPDDEASSDGDSDVCPWYAALFGGCPEDDDRGNDDGDLDSAEDETPERAAGSGAGHNDTSTYGNARDSLGRGFYFPAYPYTGGNRGNVVVLRLPRDLRLVQCPPEATDCKDADDVGVCVDGTCFRQPEPPLALPSASRQLRSGSLQLFADLGVDQDDLARISLGGVIDTNRGFGLDSRWTYWMETLETGEVDSLWLGDFNLRWECLSLPVLDLALGAGPRALVDDGGGSAGVNATASVELYPQNPLVFRVEGDVGNVGTAFAWEAQGSAGLVYKHLELYGGYSLLSFGGLRFDSVFGGLRAHL